LEEAFAAKQGRGDVLLNDRRNIQPLRACVEQASIHDQTALVLVHLLQHEVAEGRLKINFAAADDLVDEEGLTGNHLPGQSLHDAPAGAGLHLQVALHEVQRTGFNPHFGVIQDDPHHFQADADFLGEEQLLCHLDVGRALQLLELHYLNLGTVFGCNAVYDFQFTDVHFSLSLGF